MVVAAAVVVANEGRTVLVVEPSRMPPTMEPWPGNAWVMLVDIGVAVEDAELEAVSAVAAPIPVSAHVAIIPEQVTMESNAMRFRFICDK